MRSRPAWLDAAGSLGNQSLQVLLRTTGGPGSVKSRLRCSPGALERDADAFACAPASTRDASALARTLEARLHADAGAAVAARAHRARAYTIGRDVYFGAGEYAPETAEGGRLLAHELAHVAQQTTGIAPIGIQRAPDETPKPPVKQTPAKEQPTKPVKRVNVVLLGENVIGGPELATLLAGNAQIYKVKSLDEAASTLAGLQFPIARLFFITHSHASGGLMFGTGEATVDPDKIAAKLTGKVSADRAPEVVDFRGCRVGVSPKAMEGIRSALGAGSAVGGNCFVVIKRTTPLKIGGKEITKASHLTDDNRKTFEKLMDGTADNLGVARKCILNPTEKGFFTAGGSFVSVFFNPVFSTQWDPKQSVCYKNANVQTVDPANPPADLGACQLIEVKAQESVAPKESEGSK